MILLKQVNLSATMKPVWNCLSLALAASVLAACGAVGTFGTVQRYSPLGTALNYAAGGRDLHTLVVGNPFDGDQAAFARRVAATLTARNTRQPMNFTTEPGASARTQYRLVLIFNEAPRLIDFDLCGDLSSLRTGPMESGKLTVHAAFCNGTFAVRGIRGRLGGATGPDDPRLEQFLAQTAWLLLSSGNWRMRRED